MKENKVIQMLSPECTDYHAACWSKSHWDIEDACRLIVFGVNAEGEHYPMSEEDRISTAIAIFMQLAEGAVANHRLDNFAARSSWIAWAEEQGYSTDHLNEKLAKEAQSFRQEPPAQEASSDEIGTELSHPKQTDANSLPSGNTRMLPDGFIRSKISFAAPVSIGYERVLERLTNGKEFIDWPYWASRKEISSEQAAMLTFSIDPMAFVDTWEGERFTGKGGDWSGNIVRELQKLYEWLRELATSYTLETLVAALSNYSAGIWIPGNLRIAAKEQAERRQTVLDAASAALDAQSGQHQPVKTATSPPVPIRGILKQEALAAFDGMMNRSLANAIEDQPKWIKPAIVSRGTRSRKHPTLIDPVLLAIALCEKHKVPRGQLQQAFYTHPFLAEYLDDWKEKCSEYEIR